MYRLLSLAFIALLINACTTKEKGGTAVNITVNNPQVGLQVTFLALQHDGMKRVDSVSLDDQNQFTFYTNNTQPNFYRVEVPGSQVINLILDGDEKEVKLSFDASAPGKVTIDGSQAATYMLRLDSAAR